MAGLTAEDQKRLLNAAKEIYIHKTAQIKGYQTLINRASDEQIKHLLVQICKEEKSLANVWAERIDELGGSRPSSRAWKVKLLMSILGTKGFFEWAVVGEDKGIRDLAIQAEKIQDSATSETWSRIASDERLHVERIKTEVLGMEHWEIRGMIGEMILGANDGLVSILATVAGVVGGNPDTYAVLLAGIAALFAGTFSMGVSSYQSTKSEIEMLEREQEREVTKGKTPEEEREELIKFYQAEGYKKGEAEAIVARILSQQEQPIQADILDELGLAPEEIGNPLKGGVLTGFAFAISALVPIIPFALNIDPLIGLGISIIITSATLFGVGAMKTIFSRKNWIRSGAEMLVIGVSAATITYVIGLLVDKYILGV